MIDRIKYTGSLISVCAIGWMLLFSVTLKAQDKSSYTVATDGSGDYISIQKAIDGCKAFPDQRITIFVKNGTYREKVVVPSCNTKLTILGENAQKTIITFDDHFAKISRGRNSTFYTYTLLVQANDFRMENITVVNSAGPVGQAVALHVEGDRCVFVRCRILGNQDTLYGAGRYSNQLYSECYIEGTTDFIFGEATMLFEKCRIHCMGDSFITAASTPEGKPFGFVFRNCIITADEKVQKVYLGRPWRNFAKVAFLNCEMGSFVRPEGWQNWSKPESEKTTLFAEYGNTGAGAKTTCRVTWSYQLTVREAEKYEKAFMFVPQTWEKSTSEMWYNKIIQ